MPPYTPPPRDDAVVAWDARRGVFLVDGKPLPRRPQQRRPQPASPGEKILILAAVSLWLWAIGFKAAAALWAVLS